MLIPGQACEKLTAETARRLHHSGTFAAYTSMDTVAQTELRGCMGKFENKPRHQVDEASLRNISLARAVLFFAHDTSGELRAVPWVRSPQSSPSSFHYSIISEFKTFASKNCNDTELSTPLGRYPDILMGLVIPRADNGVTFIGHEDWDPPKEHAQSVQYTQHILTHHDVELDVQLGSNFFSAVMNPGSPS